jgi:hypothetical protein
VGLGEQRFDEVRQHSEALRDHAGSRRQAQHVFDDQAECLAPEPREGVEHGLWRPVHPALVHVHGLEPAQVRGVFRRAAAGVIRHHLVGRVHVQAVLGRDALSDGRLARAAAATDPVDVLQPCPQRRGVGGLFVFFRSHSSPV